MAVRVEEVAAPQSMAEAMLFLKRHPDAIPWSGGTLLLTGNDRTMEDKPVSVLDLGGIPELGVINRSERYLELGAGVLLSTILSLPPNLSLEPLRKALTLIGTASIRNLATLGGNVAARSSFMTGFSALACMDAAVELRDVSGSRWTGIHALISDDDRPSFPLATLLTRIRIPATSWDAAVIRRLGEPSRHEIVPSSFVATARFEKGTISELRIIAAGLRMVRDRTLELSLIGKRLPLSAKDIEAAGYSATAKAMETGFDETQSRRHGAFVMAFLGFQEEA
jgi:CO/xanthine dehydrogenase FAD-binding subunit